MFPCVGLAGVGFRLHLIGLRLRVRRSCEQYHRKGRKACGAQSSWIGRHRKSPSTRFVRGSSDNPKASSPSNRSIYQRRIEGSPRLEWTRGRAGALGAALIKPVFPRCAVLRRSFKKNFPQSACMTRRRDTPRMTSIQRIFAVSLLQSMERECFESRRALSNRQWLLLSRT